MSMSKEQLCLDYLELCKNKPKGKNPPTYLFFQKFLERRKICERSEVFQTRSGLGVYCKLGEEPINIGRRYGFVVKANDSLRKMFGLSKTPIIIFISGEITSTSNVKTENMFVCVPWIDQNVPKVSKCRIVSFINLKDGTIVNERDKVVLKCRNFIKPQKDHKPRKNRTECLDFPSDFCSPPIEEPEDVVIKEEESDVVVKEQELDEPPESTNDHSLSDEFDVKLAPEELPIEQYVDDYDPFRIHENEMDYCGCFEQADISYSQSSFGFEDEGYSELDSENPF